MNIFTKIGDPQIRLRNSVGVTPATQRKKLRESTRAGVADFERDLDQAVLRFPHHLLDAGDTLAGDELQRRKADRLPEDAREMERAELDQVGQRFNRDLFGQPFADVVLHFVELADGQSAADLGSLAGG
jgi:hypothetical protein